MSGTQAADCLVQAIAAMNLDGGYGRGNGRWI